MTVAQVYAPTEDSSSWIKDDFFQNLQKTVGSVARVYLMVVMGEDYCSSAVSTILGSLTHGSHTKGSTSTPRNGGAED